MLKQSEYTRKNADGTGGLSKMWKVKRKHQGVYTGGKVQVSQDGSMMACLLHDDVAILDAKTGDLIKTLQQEKTEEETEEIVAFSFRPSTNEIVTSSRNLLIRLWDIETLKVVKTIKAMHDSPVLDMDFDPTGTLVATAGSDRSVKVFDVTKGFCTHSFKGHTGIVTSVHFHPDPTKMLLVSCSDDTNVCVWDLYRQNSSAAATFTDHFSTVTSVAFSENGWMMVTSGRDKVINFWDLRRFKLLKTTPVYESIEGLCVLPVTPTLVSALTEMGYDNNKSLSCVVVTAGEEGVLKIWNYIPQVRGETLIPASCKCIGTRELDMSSLQFMGLQLVKANASSFSLVAITSEHNLVLLNESLQKTKHVIGYNDQIIALKYIPNTSIEPSFAVATNSEQIRIMTRADLSSNLLSGHTEIVLALDVSPDGRYLVSVSKDKSAKVWDLQRENAVVATCVGHTDAIGAVAVSRKAAGFIGTTAGFFVTGSADKTLKVWSMKNLVGNNSDATVIVVASAKAHDRDINAIAISPNDRLIASASQDKTIKLWDATNLTLVGTCRGHKRGVWSVVFSPVDQCIASASGDKFVKLWSVKDFTCLKTFEGHTASVLNVRFLTAGMQLMSAGADGLLKLWTIKSSECEATMDGHLDKVWALDVVHNNSSGSEIISGGADSCINVWQDVTEAEELGAIAEREAAVLKEQELFNCVQSSEFKKAVSLAFELSYPNKLFSILKSMIFGLNSEDKVIDVDPSSSHKALGELFVSLSDEQLLQLLQWTRDWNTNARTSLMAQTIVSALLKQHEVLSRLAELNVEEILNGLVAYSERHFSRLDRLVQKSYLVDYTIVSMKRLVPTEEDGGMTSEEDNEEGGSAKRLRC